MHQRVMSEALPVSELPRVEGVKTLIVVDSAKAEIPQAHRGGGSQKRAIRDRLPQ